MRMGLWCGIAAAAAMFTMAGSAFAADVTPGFAGAPTGWSTDRYQPAGFSDIGTYQGKGDVLEIDIDHSGDLDNRPAAYQSTFYNTQGMSEATSGGAGDSVGASLFIPESWSDESNGDVRTDIWAVMTDASSSITDYPILGFTNYGGTATFRYWDENLNDGNGDWVDLSNTAINYGGWNDLQITLTGSTYNYYVNGVLVAVDPTIDGSTSFSSVIMQGYNVNDPALDPANGSPYSAYWANLSSVATSVPEPACWALMLMAFAGLGFAAKRRNAFASRATAA